MATPAKRLYRTERTLTRTLRVAYPSGRGRMVLRTEQDWDRDVEPIAVSEDGNVSTFALEVDQPFLYFKPCLVEGGVLVGDRAVRCDRGVADGPLPRLIDLVERRNQTG